MADTYQRGAVTVTRFGTGDLYSKLSRAAYRAGYDARSPEVEAAAAAVNTCNAALREANAHVEAVHVDVGRLTSERDKYRNALEKIATLHGEITHARHIARAALKGDTDA